MFMAAGINWLRRIHWSLIYRGRPATVMERVLWRSRKLERIGPINLPLAVAGESEPVRFTLYYFGSYESGADYFVATPGELDRLENPLVRISSSCIWAFALGSVRCDCRWEFEESKRLAAQEPGGNAVLIYAASQNGKGVPGGLRGHALVYALGQACSDDLVYAAYRNNGFKIDYRSYDDVAEILRYLRIESLRLLTNNPDRVHSLRRLGLAVTPISLEKPYEVWDAEELGVKKTRLGHSLKLHGFDPEDIRRYGLDPLKVFGPDGGESEDHLDE